MEHPQLKYYCNQKANAIAPKITDKAKTAVQQQVNQTFIDTIVSTIAGTGDSVIKDADKETGSLMDAVINRLTSARTTLSTYDVILNSMLAITDLTSSISSSSNSAAPQVYTQLQLQQQQLITLQALVNGNSAESLNELSSALSNQMSQIQSIMSSLTELYSDMNMDVADLSAAIKLTSGSLTQTKELLSDLETKLDNAINTLNTITEQDTYGLLSEMLNADANTLGDFLSAPVNITTEQVYAVKSYGTSASPFYTILALWFGGLILVAIMHTPVHPAHRRSPHRCGCASRQGCCCTPAHRRCRRSRPCPRRAAWRQAQLNCWQARMRPAVRRVRAPNQSQTAPQKRTQRMRAWVHLPQILRRRSRAAAIHRPPVGQG